MESQDGHTKGWLDCKAVKTSEYGKALPKRLKTTDICFKKRLCSGTVGKIALVLPAYKQ